MDSNFDAVVVLDEAKSIDDGEYVEYLGLPEETVILLDNL